MAVKKSVASRIQNVFNKVNQNYLSKVVGGKSLLYNKYILYASFIVCFMTLIGWLFSREFVPVIIFILAGYLTTFFSKNMIVILVIAFVVSNVVNAGTNFAIEGMKTKENQGDDKKKGDDKVSDGKKEGMNNKKDKKEGLNNKKDKKEGMDTKKGENDNEKIKNEYEGIDEEYEGMDSGPCTDDKDCNDDQKCDTDKFVCVAK
jgi:hypothetical protein